MEGREEASGAAAAGTTEAIAISVSMGVHASVMYDSVSPSLIQIDTRSLMCS